MFGEDGVESRHELHIAAEKGEIIMPKLGNATAKAELGRASWKLLLYPCGECAQEFQQLLKKYPPQTSSRKTASLWLCFVHNLVNARLGKPEFDCLKLDETYDCGCGPEGNSTSTSAAALQRDDITGVEVVRGG
ncbi:hypothetical protein FRC05_003414 [Tulasnella sp. 425]|nr:hypothetical protein FRC05_003414 [Tulasnella sp. 425]